MTSEPTQYKQPENLEEMQSVAKNSGNETFLPRDYFNLSKHPFNSSPIELFHDTASALLATTPTPVEVARNEAVKDQQHRAKIKI